MPKQTNVVSFSLWGDNPKYTIGALKNADLVARFYPDFVALYHVGTSVPEDILQKLDKKPNTQIIRYSQPGNWTGMFWRFFPCSNPDYNVVLSRDTDSRITQREVDAVNEWLDSQWDFHVMRDHPNHGIGILGGTFGVRNGMLCNMMSMIHGWKAQDKWGTDQEFLCTIIEPLVRNKWMEHDSYFQNPKQPVRRFPSKRKYGEFVGQPFDETDKPLFPYLQDGK